MCRQFSRTSAITVAAANALIPITWGSLPVTTATPAELAAHYRRSVLSEIPQLYYIRLYGGSCGQYCPGAAVVSDGGREGGRLASAGEASGPQADGALIAGWAPATTYQDLLEASYVVQLYFCLR